MHSIEVVFAIYIQRGNSTQLTHTISFFSLHTKSCQRKSSFRNLEITTYTSCYGPQICLRQMHPFAKDSLYYHNTSTCTLCICIYFVPFIWKVNREGTVFMSRLNQQNKRPFNFSVVFRILWQATSWIWFTSAFISFILSFPSCIQKRCSLSYCYLKLLSNLFYHTQH